MTRFSIVTITKDDPIGLACTRDSVEAQSYADYEWVLIDGNKESDKGIYDAMNKGIERAKGEYLIFLNGGDSFPDLFTLSRIAKSDADFIYGDSIEDGHLKRARHNIVYGMITHHQAMCYKRSVLDELRYDTHYKIAADYKFTAQFLERAKTKHYIPKPLCIFETGGISQRRTWQGRHEQHDIREDLELCPTFVAWGIYVRQVIAQVLRAYLPDLYWRLKRR